MDGLVLFPDQTKRRRVLLAWRRHSRFIGRLRWLLTASIAFIALGLITLLIGSAIRKAPQTLRESLATIHMINPKFAGRDSQGRSFLLAAKEAARDDRDLDQFVLLDPIVTLQADGPRPTRVMARRGVYKESDRILKLNGDVQLDDGSGYRFASQEAMIDTRAGVLLGNQALNADGPTGEVQAGSFEVLEKGARSVFKGKVRARLN